MYQLIIVDDEIHAVEGIRLGMDWSKLGIDKVLTAHTVKQAKELFEEKRIDIMLCDIEMPQASGLELAQWVRERFPQTETIFLTCHADFDYAKQAIRLGSLDYILKPVPFNELEKVILKAKERIHKEAEFIQISQFGQFWFQLQPMLNERFWQDILNQTIPSNPQALSLAAADRNIEYLAEMLFLPILINIQRWHKSLTLREEKILEYGLKNSAEEILLKSKKEGLVIALSNRRILTILSLEEKEDLTAELEQEGQRYVEECSHYFYCDISCYIGQPVHGHEMLDMVNKLNELDRNNVAYNNKVFFLSKSQINSSHYEAANIKLWSVMLNKDSFDEVLSESTEYLNGLDRGVLNADLLNRVYQDFQQMMYFVLQTKGIQAHQLYSDSFSQQMSLNATRSLTNLLEWVEHTLIKAKEYVHSVEQSLTVVQKVMQFIQLNISKDISREEIANHVFLNPDYLTRIFKKETGIAVSDYLFQERLRIAKELLIKTDMQISAIASHIGYVNFSHFSRMFKKHTNMNPNEFRNTHQQSKSKIIISGVEEDTRL
ncbi:two-component system response regulator YesN [Paenibacillus amylolyticus]|uniref:Two-component system response regulator YesN n=1 Tax=Paenibacillus amylolyticus TaxID=1451 RepID=A0AAP5LJZ1_PAEAM|nr:response regulator [Paenibacillus amylolyticus]MDR6721642.1 two-component system response regulator YesN [Paenibacillus amylolyticus]